MRERPVNMRGRMNAQIFAVRAAPCPFFSNEKAATETAGFGRVKVVNYDALRRNPEGSGIERILGVVVKSPLGAQWFSGDLRG